MTDLTITVDNGDQFTVDRDPDGGLAVKIQNGAFADGPRWIRSSVPGHHDRRHKLDLLIDALTDLRDALDAEHA